MKKVKLSQVQGWAEAFDDLWRQAGVCFPRHDLRGRAEDYVEGLLGNVGRKNGWQLAEYLGDETSHGIQRLLARAS